MAFLRLSPGALATAQGGLIPANSGTDLAGAIQNPALLDAHDHPRLHSSFLALPGGSKGYFLSGSFSKANAPFVSAFSLQYIDYGSTPLTDAGGNTMGSFRPRDWSVQYLLAIPYRSRWRAGTSIQFAHSAYGTYRADAILANMGIQYRDTAQGLELGAMLRHVGFFIRRYDAGSIPQLPLELAFGVRKRWRGTPFSFGAALQRMQRWQLDVDRLYDPAFSVTGVDNRRSTFVGQFFNHLILSARVDLHPKLQLLGGYNFLRRRELSWSGGANGLTGFSMGLKAQLDRLQLVYGLGHYQAGTALHQLSIEILMKRSSKGWRR